MQAAPMRAPDQDSPGGGPRSGFFLSFAVNIGGMKPSAAIQKLWKQAIVAQSKAHAPYSRFRVGAALLGPRGKVWTGCNVENASFGGTICAERVAFLKAASDGITEGFTDLVVVADRAAVCPCGLCLQVMSEFCTGELRVWIATPRKLGALYRFQELLPKRFDKANLSG